jgi:hypothetical protein
MATLPELSAVAKAFKQQINASLAISTVFFVIFWTLDYGATNLLSGGNHLFEANWAARLWWQIMGSLRYIELPLWTIVVLSAVALIYTKSKLLALLWLNFLVFQHVLGFMTWLPYGTLNFLYRLPEWSMAYGISLMSVALALPVTLLQAKSQEYFDSRSSP